MSRRTSRALLGFALVAILGVFVPAGRAAAHAVLESASPAAGEQLPTGRPPARIELRFTEAVTVAPDGVRVVRADGSVIEVGPASHDGAGTEVVRAALPRLADGAYLVAWRAVSADGHPVQGAYAFAVGAARPEDAADRAAEALAGATSDRSVGFLFGVVRALAFAGALLLAGGAVTAILLGVRRDRGVRRFLVVAAGVTLVTGLLGFAFQGAVAAGLDLGGIVDPAAWGDAAATTSGKAWLARALLALLFLAYPALVPARSRTLRPADLVRAGTAGAVLVAVAATGHARTGRLVPLGLALDLVHLAAGALWFGGVALLVLLLWRREPPRRIDAKVERFSRFALPAIIVVAASGAVQAWRQIGAPADLTTGSYGRLVLVKSAIFVGIVAVAAVVRRTTLGRVLAPPGASAPGGHVPDRRRLRTALGVEIGLASVLLVATAALVVTVPPIEGATPKAEPFEATLTAGETTLAVGVTPAAVGPNALHVYGYTETAPAEFADLTARMVPPGGRLPPVDIPMTRVSPDHYVSTRLLLPTPGEWRLQITVVAPDDSEESVETDVAVR